MGKHAEKQPLQLCATLIFVRLFWASCPASIAQGPKTILSLPRELFISLTKPRLVCRSRNIKRAFAENVKRALSIEIGVATS